MEGGLSYSEKVALITGGARGIGEGIVRAFIAKSVGTVYFIDILDGTNLASELNSASVRCKFIKCDVTNEADIKTCVDQIISDCGRLDFLVNNVGWHPGHKPLEQVPADEFRKAFEVNVMSVFQLCKHCIPHLRATRGSIVNMSSIGTHIGQAGAATYCATKGAIFSFTKALAIDEAAHGVRVNSVSPSAVWTPLWTLHGQPNEARVRHGHEMQLTGRMISVNEVAEAVWYLAAIATNTTGYELFVSGGAELNCARKTRIGASPCEPFWTDP